MNNETLLPVLNQASYQAFIQETLREGDNGERVFNEFFTSLILKQPEWVVLIDCLGEAALVAAKERLYESGSPFILDESGVLNITRSVGIHLVRLISRQYNNEKLAGLMKE